VRIKQQKPSTFVGITTIRKKQDKNNQPQSVPGNGKFDIKQETKQDRNQFPYPVVQPKIKQKQQSACVSTDEASMLLSDETLYLDARG